MAEPEIRVWTNVGEAHIGHFGSAEAIADAKAEILEGAGPDTLVIANADDDEVLRQLPRALARRVVRFGHARSEIFERGRGSRRQVDELAARDQHGDWIAVDASRRSSGRRTAGASRRPARRE